MNSKLLLATIGIVITIAGCSSSKKTSMQSQKPTTNTDSLLKYQREITPEFLRSHLTPFSADSMEGRETGMKGQKKAAHYLANQYRKLGLQPMGDNGTYFQKFKLEATKTDSIVYKTKMLNSVGEQSVKRSVASKNSSADFIQQFGSGDTLSAEIIFAGFGVQNKEIGINQLSGTDLQGKWVMILDAPPQVVQGDTLYNDKRSYGRNLLRNIFQKGVKGILMVPNESPKKFNERAASKSRSFGKPSGMTLAYRSKKKNNRPGFGSLTVNPAKAANLLGLEDATALQKQRAKIEKSMSSFEAKQIDRRLTQINYKSKVSLETENVLAFIEGADPELKNEVVVVSAHYDHLGIGQPDSTGDRIYNGADDDGSGTIALVNIAKTFAEAAKNGVKPKRSVLLLNVTGEEKGLLGSRYYSDHPVFPVDSTIANINTDMIGRVDAKHKKEGEEDYSYIIGSDLISSQLDSLLRAGNDRTGQITLSERYNNLQDPNQFYRRSDHWNFGRLGIPFVFFFTGVHEDYHRPSDEVHKIGFNKMAKITRTIYGTTVMTANTDKAPEVDNQEFINATKVGN